MATEATLTPNTNFHTYAEWLDVLRAQGFTCFWCTEPITETSATKDHLQPEKRGGSDRIDNIVGACWGCNRLKGNMNADEFMRARPAFFHRKSEKSTGVLSLEEKNEPTLLQKLRFESERVSWAWRNPR